MGSWYTIGALLGAGVGIGLVLAGLLAWNSKGLLVALVLGVALTLPFSLNLGGWVPTISAPIGVVIGVLSGSVVVQGAMRRGGTRLGVAGFMAIAGMVLMLLAGIPLVGYALVVAVPAYAARVRSRQPTRFAGLRTLDK